jgi:hypothetical protein
MRSHFIPSDLNLQPAKRTNSMALAWAVTGATAMMTGVCSAQVTAADYATNSTYASTWSAGQNGGFGFGAWSFNGTSSTNGVADPGAQQTMSSSSAIGRAWTLFNLGSAPAGSGLSDVGRAINGGLQVNKIFETVIENPTAYHFYGGFDILFFNGTDNLPGGNNAAAIRASVFNYGGSSWGINDPSHRSTPLTAAGTGAAGMKLDLYISSATSYSLTLAALNGSGTYTQTGTLTGGPIDYVNFRLYNGLSAGPDDTANNFEISYMTVIPEPSTLALLGLCSAGLLFIRRRK